MRDVIAKDLWDAQQSAHAQIIDLQTGKEAATQVGALLLSASLSTAVNAVKGLTREEMVECLVSPLREPSDFLAAFDELEKIAWYLHHTPEGRYYFDRQENLTKLLQSLAHDAPDNQVDDLIRHRLRDMFKAVPQDLLRGGPAAAQAGARWRPVRRGARAAGGQPGLQDPARRGPEVLRGSEPEEQPLRAHRRQDSHGQRREGGAPALCRPEGGRPYSQGPSPARGPGAQAAAYEQDFNSTILSLFDKVLFPIQRAGRPAAARLKAAGHDPRRHQALQRRGADREDPHVQSRSSSTWTWRRSSTPSATRPRTCCGRRTWTRPAGPMWSTAMRSRPACRGCRRRGWTPSSPSPATAGCGRTSATVMSPRDRRRNAPPPRSLRSPGQTTRAGPAAHQSAERRPRAPHPLRGRWPGHRSEPPAQGPDPTPPSALRVNFLVCDPSGQYETGDPVTWTNKLVLRNDLARADGKRSVELFVAPRGAIRYTLDGSEPRDGTRVRGSDCHRETARSCSGPSPRRTGSRQRRSSVSRPRARRGSRSTRCKPGRLVSRTGAQARLAGQDLRGVEAGRGTLCHLRRDRPDRGAG